MSSTVPPSSFSTNQRADSILKRGDIRARPDTIACVRSPRTDGPATLEVEIRPRAPVAPLVRALAWYSAAVEEVHRVKRTLETSSGGEERHRCWLPNAWRASWALLHPVGQTHMTTGVIVESCGMTSYVHVPLSRAQ